MLLLRISQSDGPQPAYAILQQRLLTRFAFLRPNINSTAGDKKREPFKNLAQASV